VARFFYPRRPPPDPDAPEPPMATVHFSYATCVLTGSLPGFGRTLRRKSGREGPV